MMQIGFLSNSFLIGSTPTAEREREACVVVVDCLVRAGRRARCLPLPSCLLCMLLPRCYSILSVQRPMPAFPAFEGSIIHISPWQCQRKLLNVLSTTGVHACRPAEDGEPSFRSSKHRRHRNLPPARGHSGRGDDGVVVSYRSTRPASSYTWLHARENPGRPIIPKSMRPRLIHPRGLDPLPPKTAHCGIEGASSPRPTHAASVHII